MFTLSNFSIILKQEDYDIMMSNLDSVLPIFLKKPEADQKENGRKNQPKFTQYPSQHPLLSVSLINDNLALSN